MHDSQSGLGNERSRDANRGMPEKMAPIPNAFYQEKILQYLIGQTNTFRDPSLQPVVLTATQRNELIKDISRGKYNVALQMMISNDMGSLHGMSPEQMRAVCTDQVDLLRKDGSERIIRDRFTEAEQSIHTTLTSLDTPSGRATIAPLPDTATPLPQTREQVIDPELATKLELTQFLRAQKLILESRVAQLPANETALIFRAQARMQLVARGLAAIDKGIPFSQTDAPLLVYVIDDMKKGEVARMDRAVNKTGSDKEQASIAASIGKLWQMQRYIEQHQEKLAA